MDFDLDAFLQDINTVAKDLDERNDSTDLQTLSIKTDRALQTLIYFQSVLMIDSDEQTFASVFKLVEEFRTSLMIIRGDILQRETQNRGPTVAVPNASTSTISSGGRGRPKCDIKEDTILNLRQIGYKWTNIASMLLVSRTTLWRRVREMGIQDATGYSDVTDDELDSIIRSYKEIHGAACGRSMVIGHLATIGLRVQQRRISKALNRVDPSSSYSRWAKLIKRRKYSVPGPNSLWHIDGHHSLINWKFVIHGGIDGFSRLIVFLKCGLNNRKETVLELFDEAIDKYGVPSRVRTDKGGENVLVWDRMIEKRGPDRGSYLAGSSVHNQRIERLWRDVWNNVCCNFYYTFKSMEDQGNQFVSYF